MEKQQQPIIIIKKIKKAVHGGHHGGAWKVAYADFVTAMMAFFLVMWLVSVLSIESKKAIAEYFRSFSVFEGSKAGGMGVKVGVAGGDIIQLEKESGSIKGGSDIQIRLAYDIGRIVEANLKKTQMDQVLINATDKGVRIEMVEKAGSPMFESGKTGLLAVGADIIKAVSESIKNTTNDIIIEGHTDAYQYQKDGYTNWELAADRANVLRRELINDGIDAARIKQVASFADNLPIRKDDPYAPINRRVSILLLNKKKDRLIEETRPENITSPDILNTQDGPGKSVIQENPAY